MRKKFEINQTKIKGGCQSGRKVITHNSKSDLPLCTVKIYCFYEQFEIHISFVVAVVSSFRRACQDFVNKRRF